jgi:hypothetical protein
MLKTLSAEVKKLSNRNLLLQARAAAIASEYSKAKMENEFLRQQVHELSMDATQQVCALCRTAVLFASGIVPWLRLMHLTFEEAMKHQFAQARCAQLHMPQAYLPAIAGTWLGHQAASRRTPNTPSLMLRCCCACRFRIWHPCSASTTPTSTCSTPVPQQPLLHPSTSIQLAPSHRKPSRPLQTPCSRCTCRK